MALTYTPLNTNKSEIRLLRIEPGEISANLYCSLIVASLNTKPKYEALSYIWGDPSITTNITVDGVLHPITVNLEHALRSIRKAQKPRVIWADALCINQRDTIEKNNQLPLMARIYAEATEVIACLGESSPDLDFFATWAEVYHSRRPKFLSLRWLKKDLPSWLTPTRYIQRHMQNIRIAKGEIVFFMHAYFQRMWIIQELALAKKAPIFLIGQKSFRISKWDPCSFRMLRDSGRAFQIATEHEFASQQLRREFDDLNQQTLRVLEPMAYDGSLFSQPYFLGDTYQSFPLSLFVTSHRNCFDPRDRIYALYSLTPGLETAHPANYQKPPEQVLLDTICYFMRAEPSYIFDLSTWPLRPSRLEDVEYPSWLPDLTGRTPRGYTTLDLVRKREHGGLIPTIHNNILSVSGWNLGKCSIVFRFSKDAAKNLLTIFELMAGDISLVPESMDSGIRSLEGTTLHRRMVYACYYHDFIHPKTFPEEKYREVLATYGTKCLHRIFQEQVGWDIKVIGEKAARLADKVMFITDSGLFGTCSNELKSNDVLVYSESLAHPIVLRSQDEYHDWNGTSLTKLVDFAFVDGITCESKHEDIMKWVHSQKLEHIRIR